MASKKVRAVVLQSMKKDLRALEERGPVASRAFAGHKPTASEARTIDQIRRESWASTTRVWEQQVAHAAERVRRYAAGGPAAI